MYHEKPDAVQAFLPGFRQLFFQIFVIISAHRINRRYFLQFIQNFSSADVSRMQDRAAAGQMLKNLRAQQVMSVGNDSDFMGLIPDFVLHGSALRL